MSAEHVEKQYSIFQIAMNLTIACFVSGAIIAAIYYITAPIAAQKAIELKNDSMKSLVKEAEGFKPVDGKTEWYVAEKGGQPIAYIVPGETKGYGGAIKMLVAVTPDGKIIDYSITAHNETPGLGDNASKPKFRDQFKGKVVENLEVTKDPSQTDKIQAMTGATISSRAVTKGVKEAVEQYKQFAGGK